MGSRAHMIPVLFFHTALVRLLAARTAGAIQRRFKDDRCGKDLRVSGGSAYDDVGGRYDPFLS